MNRIKKLLIEGLWKNHPVFRQLIGMCPTLAVTTSAINGLSMGLSVIFVLTCASFIVSSLRKIIPPQVRIAVFTIIIATFVTLVDLFLKAYFPEISKSLGPYVPLIIVNCIILGRMEAFASRNPVIYSVLDGLFMGTGFTWGLVILASIREILGGGTIFGINLYQNGKILVMILPAGAFFALGFLVALMNLLEKRKW